MRLLHEVGVQCARAGNDFLVCLQQIVKVAVASLGPPKAICNCATGSDI